MLDFRLPSLYDPSGTTRHKKTQIGRRKKSNTKKHQKATKRYTATTITSHMHLCTTLGKAAGEALPRQGGIADRDENEDVEDVVEEWGKLSSTLQSTHQLNLRKSLFLSIRDRQCHRFAVPRQPSSFFSPLLFPCCLRLSSLKFLRSQSFRLSSLPLPRAVLSSPAHPDSCRLSSVLRLPGFVSFSLENQGVVEKDPDPDRGPQACALMNLDVFYVSCLGKGVSAYQSYVALTLCLLILYFLFSFFLLFLLLLQY